MLTSLSNVQRVGSSIGSPRAISAGQHLLNRTYKNWAKDGHFVELVTSAHPEEKIAALGRAFEKMQEHPLCKEFLHSKPKLYIDRIGGTRVSSPIAATAKMIIIPQSAYELQSLESLEGSVGHELGHLLRRDMDPRWGLRLLFRSKSANHEAERMADEIGVLLSGKADATKTGMTVMTNAIKSTVDDSTMVGGLQKTAAGGGGFSHPLLADRISHIDQVARQLESPEGRQSFVDNLFRQLTGESGKLPRRR